MAAQGFVVYECDQPGAWLEMPFTLEQPLSGEVHVMLHAYGNRGILRAQLNEGEWSEPIDCHVPRPGARWIVPSLGEHELQPGEHTLRVELVRRKEGVPTGWIALGGVMIRPEGSLEAEPPVEREWTRQQWDQFVAEQPAAAGSVIERVEFRDPATLDYRLRDADLAGEFGPRWSEHLDWLTDEHLQRISDPESSFYADHFHWDRSQGRPE
jgi:hypothetical protein